MGWGTSPWGTGAYGLGTPVTAAAPPDGPAGSRYINPASRDYQLDSSTGQLAQMPPVRQRVLLTVMTVLGSSSVNPAIGTRAPRKMGTQFEAQTRASVRSAFHQMTDVEKVIRIDRIDVERGAGGRARTTIVYTDLTTEEQDQVTA